MGFSPFFKGLDVYEKENMLQEKLHIVQIVRNWGQVGGMESYVWQLSHELARQNYCVTVICEREHAKPEIQGIEVIELGKLLQKPRWVMYWRFANRVNEKIKYLGLTKDCVIHSHERSISHDITTFHSIPFATIKEKSWLKRLSIRVWVYLKMENRELGGLPNQSVSILPVSWRIAVAIQKYYPHVTKSIERPIFPGVASLPLRPIRCIPKDGGTIGFFGTEWNRKGFALFIKIAEQLRILRPNLKVMVLGVQKSEVVNLCDGYGGDITFLGWQPSANFYKELDLLIHPASSEAYGMVIAEAMACRVPVVLSENCGAAEDVSINNGSVLSLKMALSGWVSECSRWLSCDHELSGFERPWNVVATQYISKYDEIRLKKLS
jgi:UDP-glucose:(heptosyl)LPS alpha-1,3-glucosyltransferase